MIERISTAGTFPDLAFPLKVEATRLMRPEFRIHTHAFTELVVVTGGQGVHVADGKRHPVTAGDVWVLKGCEEHGFEESAGLGLVNVMLVPEALPLPLPQLRGLPGYQALFVLEPVYRARYGLEARLRLGPALLARVVDLLQRAQAELSSGAPGYRAMALALLIEAVVALSREYPQAPETHDAALMRLAHVLTAVESEPERPWCLREMAEMARLSVNQFIRAFRAATGHTPLDHLLSLRVQLAANLLTAGDSSITDVAMRSGFADASYFSRQFRRQMGVSPTAFRAGCRH